MLPLQGSILTAVAAAAPLASILLATSSRFLIVADAAESTKINSIVDEIATSIDINNKSERKLFEIASPFDFFNDQCARACSSQEEHGETNDEELFANPCPKCHDRYSPCNFCCYHGASSLKLRFFGCSGNTSIVLDDLLDDNGCNYNGCDEWTSVNTTSNEIDSGVQFVDCDCFDDATNISSSSFGDIASCDLFDHKIFYPASSDRAASSFDLCLVSTTNCRNGPVANFSQPLPDVIGLKHFRNGNAAFGNDVTFFETTCDEKGITSSRNFTNPLFPGYGKLAGTCPDIGYIDFENNIPSLSDDIVFIGEPPSGISYYRFIDGTSPGFWPNGDGHIGNDSTDDNLFFNPTFARCDCRDCNDAQTMKPSHLLSTAPTSDPLSQSHGTPEQPDFLRNDSVPSHSPSTKPSIERSNVPSSVDPSVLPSSGPSVSPSMPTNENPSESPSASFSPSSTPSIFPSNSIAPSAPPSTNPSEHPTDFPTIIPSHLPSETPSKPPSASHFPSSAPSSTPSRSPVPSASPSINPSEHASDPPTRPLPSEVPSSNPSGLPSTYRFPTSSPSTHAIGPMTPSPFHQPTTPAPVRSPSVVLTDKPTHSSESPSTVLVSTELPTNFPSTVIPTTHNPTNEGCHDEDETECFIFAVVNCVDEQTRSTICIPPLGSRRFLEEQILFHQEALAELHQHKQWGNKKTPTVKE